jgi:hypothetical protein
MIFKKAKMILNVQKLKSNTLHWNQDSVAKVRGTGVNFQLALTDCEKLTATLNRLDLSKYSSTLLLN